MGLSEGKRKQRLVGSARTNNVAWSNDASLPGQRLLASMGWEAGQGIGQSQTGRLAPVSVAFKMDNKGIGAQRMEREARAQGKADAWIGGGGELGNLFDRLNAAAAATTKAEPEASSSSIKIIPDDSNGTTEKKSKKDKKEKKHKKHSESTSIADVSTSTSDLPVTPPVFAVNPRMAARARYLRAKRMVGNDLSSVNEILGIASPSGSNSPAPVMSPMPSQSDVEIVENNKKEDSSDSSSSESDKKDKKKKRKREEVVEDSKEARRAEKEERRRKKEERRSLKAEKKEKKDKDKTNKTKEVAPITFSDPSFDASGGGNRVSHLSVQQYLSNKLMLRKAEVLRKRRSEEEGIWNRAATVKV